ncbi:MULTISPECIES: transglutaminase-like domain-containing protein [Pseudomonas]|jgi:transglutaminase-like putative cysteine protease|uniref:transglutaminase-like domain-containing protein n=1 Tax=Pseudomonas TaxID=286 RepID=UPI0005BCDB39|nr:MULTISPECIES: transglutaminase family protein [Pseudomonas]KWR79508.1 cysteine protease [Pseudomonas sp. PI1]MCP1603667.1 transglutaminase-like putative cysteine protease [Pseudomonas citronellolis]MCP1653266.1 transglutaminase-like putative cysteine protease [Pseudomonas citronellolis]MCP1720414.1 transglutaminase-like putative cysteine protease [Pseudomonas citronellolis]WAB90105.1 transglutaminase family protein [Pseudomonas citronellolis]
MQAYLEPGRYLDSDHPAVIEFAQRHRGASPQPREQAVALYYAVRDGIRYNPYVFSLDAQTLKASHALQAGQSYCVPKAALLAACARHCGIPARIGLADVKNHLASGRMVEMLRSEVFAMHGYTELFLDGRWVKATPAFNRELCEAFGVLPLEFDGRQDSVFHEFDQDGRRHMEYLCDHGQFADVPEDLFFGHLRACYPHLFDAGPTPLSGDMQAEAPKHEGNR